MNIDFAELNPSLDKELREYQVEYKTKIYKAWETKRSVMLQMPTGTGKTRLFVSIVKDLHRLAPQDKPKILILAHRKELIEQIFKEVSGKYQIPSSIIMASNFESNAVPVQVASVKTLYRSKRLDKWKNFGFDYIIIDEAHHVNANSYRYILNAFPDAKLLGVTATPYRMSGGGFDNIFDELIISQSVIEFIRQGYLCDYEYFSIPPLNKLHKQISNISKFDIEGDYLDREMMNIMDKKPILAGIVDTYLKYAKGKKGIVYTIDQNHNEHIRNQFAKADIRAKAIDSRTDSDERAIIVQQFRDGKIDVLCNVNIFSEGFDCPDVEFIQLARPTRSLALFLQQVGRGLRPSPGKDKVVFLDIVGSYNSFGFPSTKREWQTYFKGFDNSNPPDESPKNNDDEEHQVNYIQTFDEGEEDIFLLDSTFDDEQFKSFLEDVTNKYKDGPFHKDAFREYLSKKYSNGTINNYLAIIPNHIDWFIRNNYNLEFTSLYYIIDLQILTRIKNKLYLDSEFNRYYSRNQDRLQQAIERYISFSKEYFVVFNRSPEEINAIDEANKNREIRYNRFKSINNLTNDLYSICSSYESKEQSIPNDILEKAHELQELLNKYKECSQG
jgi:superfamily II DNA or RNA helicase